MKEHKSVSYSVLLEACLEEMILNKMGHNGFNFMLNNYTTTISYKKIMESRKKVCN